MMNVLGLSLVLTSMAAAGVFSPSPADTQQKQNTIVKEGHRVVVVEYDQDGHHNTKISISPSDQDHDHDTHAGVLLNNAKDKIKEAASVLPNMGQGISSSSQSQDGGPHHKDHHAGPYLHASKDLICDAYGKCKHKIASAMGKAKDMAQDVLELEKDSIAAKREAAREVGHSVADAVGKAKDKAQDAKEYTVDKAKEMGQTLKNDVVRNVSEGRDKLRGVKGALKRVGSYLALGSGSMAPAEDTFHSLMGVAHLMGFATAYGMCVWVTFISSYVLSRAMPRQQFAVVQSKIYPVYFRAMAYCIGMALLGHVLAHTKKLQFETLQASNLLTSLFTVFVNSVYLEPRATKLMFERMKLEKEEGRGREDITGPASAERRRTDQENEHSAAGATGPNTESTTTTTTNTTPARRVAEPDAFRSKIIKLNEKLKKLNSYSSILNILNLMSLTWHLVDLAQRLHHIC